MENDHDDMVSVIMPAYNSEQYIGESIASVLTQSYRNLELLITDDCSLDGTQQVIEELARHDRRVRYFRLNENSGAAIARNNSLKMLEADILPSWMLTMYGSKTNWSCS